MAAQEMLGSETGLSASRVSRLTEACVAEHERWQRRSLAGTVYVYLWADAVHFTVRLEEDRLCCLVLVGVRPDGSKELVAVQDGYREDRQSWLDLLRDLREHGMQAPALAVGDGALGFCAALHRVSGAAPRAEALEAARAFGEQFAPWPKATAKVADNLERLLAFHDFPSEHHVHLCTTNPIESTFATVRLRQRVTKGAGSRAGGSGDGLQAAGRSAAALAAGERAPPRRRRAGRRCRAATALRDARQRHPSRGAALPQGPGREARLCYMGHLLTENRHGLVVDVALTEANGYAEREAALAMVERSTAGHATLGADRGYDARRSFEEHQRGGGQGSALVGHVTRQSHSLRLRKHKVVRAEVREAQRQRRSQRGAGEDRSQRPADGRTRRRGATSTCRRAQAA